MIRPLPHNLEAEQGLLGTILVRNSVLDTIDPPAPGDFYNPGHARLFSEIKSRIEASKSVTHVGLKLFADEDPDLRQVGGGEYVSSLVSSLITSTNAAEYSRTIIDLAKRRELIRIAREIEDHAYTEDADPLIETAAAELTSIADRSGKDLIDMNTAAINVVSNLESIIAGDPKVNGIKSGLTDLDKLTNGFFRGNLIILAGRPGMGKSAMAGSVAVNMAQNNIGVGVFSLEMTAEEWVSRIIASKSGVPADKQLSQNISKQEIADIRDAAEQVSKLPIYFRDDAGLTVARIQSHARAMKRKGVKLLIIDHLGLIAPSKRNTGNRVQDLTEITGALKAMAKTLDMPVVVLSQLNRAVEGRDDKRPQLFDLRDSGSIEQDADVILFLYRDEYYAIREEPKDGDRNFSSHLADWHDRMSRVKNKAELIIAKQRMGQAGKTVHLFFDAAKCQFRNLANVVSYQDYRNGA